MLGEVKSKVGLPEIVRELGTKVAVGLQPTVNVNSFVQNEIPVPSSAFILNW